MAGSVDAADGVGSGSDDVCTEQILSNDVCEEKRISMAEVKQHCFEDSAWMVIGDGV